MIMRMRMFFVAPVTYGQDRLPEGWWEVSMESTVLHHVANDLWKKRGDILPAEHLATNNPKASRYHPTHHEFANLPPVRVLVNVDAINVEPLD
jgi:hypothetical protein